jgi:pimeloyl-ACP methyl ester carboxylesterase
MPITRRLLTAGLAAVLLAGPLAMPAAAAPPDRAPAATTSAAEKRRVDRVRTPRLAWATCHGYAQCATASVPLDYDHPTGKQIKIALLRVRAKDQKHKIGSLFVNPGGPGAPASDLALAAPLFLSDPVLNRFDIVGMDPRGIGGSTNVNCFGSTENQEAELAGMRPLFPYGAEQEDAYIASARAFGRACSTRGAPLSGAMSTAEVARDMEVMRRAVGDSKLNYLGFSYGTALGQYYANMFPDRFRTLIVDGVINPVAWVGTRATAETIQDVRLNSAGGAYKALVEIMNRCDRAGTTRCVFAEGNAKDRFLAITRRLKAGPVTVTDPLFGSLEIAYADFIGDILSALYGTTAGDDVTALSQQMWTLTSSASASEVAAARTAYTRIRSRLGRAYDNSFDSYAAVMCTDGKHPSDASKWPAQAAAADRRAPYFGRAWAWASVQCARRDWTVRDEDAYVGPWTRRTGNTVLVVGSYWDPATNYYDAKAAAALLPNSRLLSSSNWGHTAYGTSACVTGAMDRYLLSKTLPAKGTVCAGADQPFTARVTAAARTRSAAGGSDKILPPVFGR